jgi:putative DNA primase/helicase
MRFEDFARMHGLIFNSIIPHKWVSTPTVDHPRSGNGRYKYLGDVGFVQNWATMEKPAIWKADESYRPHPDFIRAKNNAAAEREELAKKAAAKAGWILHQCTMRTHPYLEKKGFPEEEGNVWVTDEGSKLVIPMRLDSRLVGCQLIDEQGTKKFLYGQRTKGASFSFADKLDNIFFCEGYATGLSIRQIMKTNSMKTVVMMMKIMINKTKLTKNKTLRILFKKLLKILHMMLKNKKMRKLLKKNLTQKS